MLTDLLKNWRDWGLNAEPTLIETFSSGQNHHTALIAVNDKRYVLKIFEHSFEHAMAAERWTSEQLLSPKLHYAKDNVALFDYVDDLGFEISKLDQIAKSLGKLHQTGDTPDLGKFDILAFCDLYLAKADTKAHAWHNALMPALLSYQNDTTPWAFCHNDLVTENCLFSQDKVVFIDWEYAQRHNPWFDLAAIIHYFHLSKLHAALLLKCYRDGWEKKISEPIFYTSQIAVLWCDLLWNIHTIGDEYWAQNQHRFIQLSDLASKAGINLARYS